jgi:hypothetical protein
MMSADKLKNRQAWGWFVLAAFSLTLGACHLEPSEKKKDEFQTESDSSSSGETQTETVTESETESDSGSLCEDGLLPTPFDLSASEVGYDLPAPDFTVHTTTGPWTLSEHWNGCDNYIFVLYHPGYGDSADEFWGSDIGELVEDSAPNAHYFFVTLEPGLSTEQRQARVMEIGERIQTLLEKKDEATQNSWMGRLHYVTDPGRDISVIDGVLKANYSEVHFTIDRRQLIREGHNTSYYTFSGWKMQLRNTRYWAKYFNAQYLLDERLKEQEKSEDVLVHRVVSEQDITGDVPFLWTLPDAATMSEYGKLEVDMRVGCSGVGHPYRSTCGEWDTVGSIWLCGDEECTSENRRRIIKWITPYSAPGRWVIDITPELVALASGGQMRFMAQHGDNNVGPYTYKYTVDLRFSKSAEGLRPFAVETLIPENNYPFESMAEAFAPFEVTPPTGAVKVELYALISGHGAITGSGCAEFCTFEHTFDVNGVDHQHIYRMESQDRCAEWVELGVTPNQGGTWHFDRSSWCPGWTTELWREDLTGSFVMDTLNAIEHIPTYHGGPPPGGNMDARVELVYYRQIIRP